MNRLKSTLLILAFIIGLFSSCQKENNGNEGTDTPVVAEQIPSIDEYMPERLLHLFDSLNVLHRGDTPPTIEGNFVAESLYRLIIDKVPESPYIILHGSELAPYYFEFDEVENSKIKVTLKSPIGEPQSIGYYCTYSNSDSTYYRIKDNIAHFTDDPIAPSYFKSSRFKADDFRHAYVIGKGDYFTLYYYEIRENYHNYLPLIAVIVSGKMSVDSEGNPIIEDFWYGVETMKYYAEDQIVNTLIQYGYCPMPGDIIIHNSTSPIVSGSYNE